MPHSPEELKALVEEELERLELWPELHGQAESARYGAVEMGVHRFHHPGHEDTEGVGEASFIHLWQYKDGAWKITRVISYDYHGAAK